MPRSKPPDLSHLARPGAELPVRATPRARRPSVAEAGGVVAISVTEPAADGQANAAIRQSLAAALGVARTRLTLIRGATSRDKVFRLD